MAARRRGRHRRDSGYALLVVFLMAAIAAIELYSQLPRVAMESQRQKEQLLMERGEQYKRAIQLFLRASNNQRWPASLDELESFNGKRFLRRRYKDPMTGKEEWRLIHIQNGVLTDSVTNKPPGQKGDSGKDELAGQASVGDYGSTVGSYNAPAQGGANLSATARRRQSDGAAGATGGVPGVPGSGTPDGSVPPPGPNANGGQPGQPGQGGNPTSASGGLPGVPGVPGNSGTPGMPGVPGLPGVPPGTPGAPGVLPPGVPGGVPGSNNSSANQGGGSTIGNYGGIGSGNSSPQPNSGFAPGPPANSQNFGGTPAYPTASGSNGNAPGFGQPGMTMSPGQAGAAQSLINGLLTTARPGGLAGIGRGQVIGGGIAGVASTSEGDAIMVYHDRTNYNEWEFIFDPSRQHYPPPNPVSGAAIGTPAAQMGSMPMGNVGTPAAQLGSMPGSMPGMMQGPTTTGAVGGGAFGGGPVGAAGPGGGMMTTMPATGAPGTPGTTGTPTAVGTTPFGGAANQPDIRPGKPW